MVTNSLNGHSDYSQAAAVLPAFNNTKSSEAKRQLCRGKG